MSTGLMMSRNVNASDLEQFLDSLRIRGVVALEGRIFFGGNSRGTPPEEAMIPEAVMETAAAPLTEGETAAAIVAIRQFAIAVIAREVKANPMVVELAEAHYRVDINGGIDLEIEMHGLVNRVARVALN